MESRRSSIGFRTVSDVVRPSALTSRPRVASDYLRSCDPRPRFVEEKCGFRCGALCWDTTISSFDLRADSACGVNTAAVGHQDGRLPELGRRAPEM